MFITGFPEDVKERELNNMLRFLPGYEVRRRAAAGGGGLAAGGTVLKLQAGPAEACGSCGPPAAGA